MVFKLFIIKNKKLFSLVIFTVICAANISNAYANSPIGVQRNRTIPKSFDSRCTADVQHNPNKPIPDGQLEQTPITIESDTVNAEVKDTITYKGEVVISQGDKTLKADSSTFNQATQDVEAKGNIFYQDTELTAKNATELKTNLESNNTELKDPEYYVNNSIIRGKASLASLNKQEKSVHLEDVYLTTCPKNQESWSIYASSININEDDAFGEAWNTVFNVGPVPIIYIPYINFPIKNQRKTGFLYPNFEYDSTDGYIISTPFYVNLHPSYDLTLTPKVIQHRGVIYGGQFRYMPFSNTIGTVYGEYMYKDKKPPEYEKGTDFKKRWLFSWKQKTYWDNEDYGLLIDYNKVRPGDYDYINDFDPKNVSSIDNQLAQSIKLYMDKSTFDASIEYLQYQLLLPETNAANQPFELAPAIHANHRNTLSNILAYNLSAEFTRFNVDDYEKQGRYKGDRLHLQSEFELPLIQNNGIYVKSNTRLFYTYYNQDIPSVLNSKYRRLGFDVNKLEEHVSRWLYQTDLTGKMVFENNLENGYTMSLEPVVQYSYMPYKNQDNIGVYDSSDRKHDYFTLFNYKTYSGNDRFTDINRISYGVNYNIYDERFIEVLQFSIGQSYSFHDTRMTLYPIDAVNTYPRSPISSSLNVQFIPELSLHGDISYNTEERNVSNWHAQSNLQVKEYEAQVGYRYTRDGNRTLKKREIVDVKQLSGSAILPITRDLKAIAVMHYDLEQKKNIDQKIALKYESCCYAIGFYAERYNKPDNYTLTSEDKHKFGIFFELKGVAGVAVAEDFNRNTKLLPYSNSVNLSR